MSIECSAYSKSYYRNLKEDCATEAVMAANSYKEQKTPFIDSLSTFWGLIAERLASNGGYQSIRKAFKIAFFVYPIDPVYVSSIYNTVKSQLQKLSNEEIIALISTFRFVKRDIEFIRRIFIIELVRRNVPGVFAKVWHLASQEQSLCYTNVTFYADVAIERAKNQDIGSIEEAISLARCIKDHDSRRAAFKEIILEKFKVSSQNSLFEPLEISSLDEAVEWLTLFRHVPNCDKLLPRILAARAIRGDTNGIEIAVNIATKIENNNLRHKTYHKIAEEYAKQPGGDASLRAWEILQLLPRDYSKRLYLLGTLMTTFLQKKDRQSFVLARQIPKQINRKVEQDCLTRLFGRELAARATNSAWAGSLIKLTQKLLPTYETLSTLHEIAMHIARNSDDETGQSIDKIAGKLNEYWKDKIAVTVIVELAKKKIIPIPTVLSLATSKLRGENRDTVLQEIAIQSAKRSSSSEEAMAIAASIETESIKAEA